MKSALVILSTDLRTRVFMEGIKSDRSRRKAKLRLKVQRRIAMQLKLV